jgi:hypothetical protein
MDWQLIEKSAHEHGLTFFRRNMQLTAATGVYIFGRTQRRLIGGLTSLEPSSVDQTFP